MILYTTQPAELIFPTDASAYQCSTARVGGQLVMGVRQGRSFQVTRLLSTDPAAYLNPGFTPGAQIFLDENDSETAAF
ncbi:YlzJ-like family protein [Zongyangia hominis]|uniref:YlzJ-like family protein n=1 Tax=Zongyangia hominis TaxID=2763677 RepID=A0A926IB77_9FIRM|nr:YlzJ-like family protein [Zongyangia hominis]MBC8570961.1 YlzJ-like family protein [Zongyangia hominis]